MGLFWDHFGPNCLRFARPAEANRARQRRARTECSFLGFVWDLGDIWGDFWKISGRPFLKALGIFFGEMFEKIFREFVFAKVCLDTVCLDEACFKTTL